MVRNIVKHGYLIPFKDGPPPCHGVRNTPLVGQYAQVLLEEVQTLLDKDAIMLVPSHQIPEGFYSTYFLVPKKTGDLRPILNLKPFNKFVHVPTFKMETLQNVIMSVNQGNG